MSLFPFSPGTILNQSKNLLIASALQTWFNSAYPRIGSITKSQFDTAKHSFNLEFQPHGEADAIRIDVKKYRLLDRDGETYIELTDVKTSRSWINNLLADFSQPNKRQFKVPSAIKILL